MRDGETRQIGVIGVDAGLCWIGDPCYILHQDKPPKAIGRSWSEFCGSLRKQRGDSSAVAKQFNYDLGHPGLGCVVQTGGGDGVYPVFVEYTRHGEIKSVTVKFIGDETEDA